MMTKLIPLRWWLLYTWLLSAIVVVAIFAERMFGSRQLPMHADEIAASFKTVMAFYVPTIGMMLSYLFAMRPEEQACVFSAVQTRTIIALSAIYHLVFIAVVVMGISFNLFDQSKPGGEGFAANTSTVASLLGGLSLILLPVNVLFLKSDKKGSEGRAA